MRAFSSHPLSKQTVLKIDVCSPGSYLAFHSPNFEDVYVLFNIKIVISYVYSRCMYSDTKSMRCETSKLPANILRLVKKEILIDDGVFSTNPSWQNIEKNILEAIKSVVNPIDSNKFLIYPEKEGNGVVPIKEMFLQFLKKKNWQLETPLAIAQRAKMGALDATIPVTQEMLSKDKPKLFAVEWETGNISSSHRALNKMTLGIMKGILAGGALILPTRKLYFYLTDRVGNYEELAPYFDLWKSITSARGLLAIYAVEQDGESTDVSKIRKGTDGRALR